MSNSSKLGVGGKVRAKMHKICVDYAKGIVCGYGDGTDQVNPWHTRDGLFVTPNPESRFFDRELATLTEQINELWNATQRNNRDSDRVLTVLVTEQGLMTAWSSAISIYSVESTPEEISQVLGL